ncbi:MAG: Nif3-like dinuclear metal center hexameric protein [Phycisphaeraceae bacterium]|nr:Nif3-like dinuclear metal center hexameric protein [Phycisphaeraceae bacterium]
MNTERAPERVEVAMKVRDLMEAMQQIAPLRYAESWDNVGLLVGSARKEIRGPVLLTIDLTEAVVLEAAGMRASAVVAYHPVIFHPIRRIADEGLGGHAAILLKAIESGLAVYCPHSALDAAPGGMTDWLADGLLDRKGVVKADRRALVPHIHRHDSQQVKVVTFVPAKDVEQVRLGMATAGAGLIGNYEVCSFASDGRGTFRGLDGSKPSVGEAGKLEEVTEVRLEMVCSRHALPLAVETLRQFHPYEEPAIDVYELSGVPERSAGAGRRLVLDQPVSLERLADRLKTHLFGRGRGSGPPGAVQIAAAAGAEGAPVSFVGICPGAGASLAGVAKAEGCQVFVTGEMKHHEVLEAIEPAERTPGMSVIVAGHTATERGYLPRLAERLREMLDGVKVEVSAVDRSPFVLQ